MALYVKTCAPQKVLAAFKEAIDDGRISTWSYDKDGDFTLTSDQWKNRAWFIPKIEEGSLSLFIIKPKNSNITSETYAVYHGRFVESMLVHCDTLFADCLATALPSGKDKVAQE